MGKMETDEVKVEKAPQESDFEEAEKDYAEFKKIYDKEKRHKKKNKGSHRDKGSKSNENENLEKVTSEKVKVIVRCRPLSDKEKAQGHTSIVQIAPDSKALEVHRPNPASTNLVNAKVDKTFTFDAVYDERTSQSQLYEEAFKDLVDSVLEGFNGTIFAYGQTASGKTYTMEGIRDLRDHQGVIPNAFRHIFKKIEASPKSTFLVSASYLEIYQEEVKDLLSPKLKICDLKESSGGGVTVKGLTNFLCRSFDEMNSLMTTGNKNRSVGATNMNEHSSRSHAVFMISVEMSETWADGEVHVKVGHLNLVDLAGSERQGKTGAEGERLKEAVKINLSLSALGNVIGALADNKGGHVPYRDSKLTRLLQNSLGGNARTIMVATIGPASFNYDETIVTLRYASRAKRIKNKPRINEDPKDAMLRTYQDEISKLRVLLNAKLSGPRVSSSGTDSGRQIRIPGGMFDSTLVQELESYGVSTNEPKEVLKVLAEKRRALLNDTATVKEEKERLLNKLESTHQKVEQAEDECGELHSRIEWLQSKVLNSESNLVEHTNEQKRMIEQRELELDEEKVKEDEIRDKISEHDLSVTELREISTSLEIQLEYDEKKAKKFESKATKVREERESRAEKHTKDVARLRRFLATKQKDDELGKNTVENFVPPKLHQILNSLLRHNEDDTYSFLPMTSVTLPRPRVNRMILLPIYLKSLDGVILPRPDFYYVDENILQLHPILPTKVTRPYVPPDTDPHLKSVMERALAEAEKDVVIDCNQGPRRRVKTARVRLGEELSFENNWTVRQVLSAKHRSKEIPYKDFVAVKRPATEIRGQSLIPSKGQLRRVNHVSLSPNLSIRPMTLDTGLCVLPNPMGSSTSHAQSYHRPCVTPEAQSRSRPSTAGHSKIGTQDSICARLEILDKLSFAVNSNDPESLYKLDELEKKRRRLIESRQKSKLGFNQLTSEELYADCSGQVCLDWVNDLEMCTPPPTAIRRSWPPGWTVKDQFDEKLPYRTARHLRTAVTEPERPASSIRARTNCFPPQTSPRLRTFHNEPWINARV